MLKHPRTDRRSLVKLPLIALASQLPLLRARTAAAGPPYDDTEPAWINGVVRHGYIRLGELEARGPDVNIYLVGTIDLEHPMEVALRPGSPTVHDHVSTLTPYGRRGRCHVYMLLPGPNATEDTVRVRYPVTAPGFEWVIHPYEIDLGDGFVPLVSAGRIEEGLAAGLLALSFDLAEGLNATCWSGGEVPSFPRYDLGDEGDDDDCGEDA